MIYSKGYCDSCDTDNCEHANPLRLGRVDQTPQQAAIVKALDERATLLARVEAVRVAVERAHYSGLSPLATLVNLIEELEKI